MMEEIEVTQVMLKDGMKYLVEENITEVSDLFQEKEVLELTQSYGGDEIHIPKENISNWKSKEIPKIAGNINEV